jgi:hypothetical protein
MKYLISGMAVAFLLATGAPAFAADPAPAPAASTKMKKGHHAKTHGMGMMHHEAKKAPMGKKGKAVSPDHSADSLNADELAKLQAGK